MDVLPYHLLDKILLELDQKSLSMIRCTNRSLDSYTHDPSFETQYMCRVESGLVHVSAFGSNLLFYLPYTNSRSTPRMMDTLLVCQVLASCSGLLLLLVKDRLCVANPLTKKYRFLDMSIFMDTFDKDKNRKRTGLAVNRVNRIDRATHTFSIVHLIEIVKPSETRYRFLQVNSENSWRFSKTDITCSTSNLSDGMKSPVYFNGSLHWLRNDGGIVAFDPETEQARLIPVKFPERSSFEKTLFAATSSNLALISATEKVIAVYTLENILSEDPKWVIARRIPLKETDLGCCDWNLEAYDGKFLVLSVDEFLGREVHVYDLVANKSRVACSIPGFSDANRDVFQFTMSMSCVVGLDEILTCGDEGMFGFLRSIMGLIDGKSQVEVGKLLSKESSKPREKRLLIKGDGSFRRRLSFRSNNNNDNRRRLV